MNNMSNSENCGVKNILKMGWFLQEQFLVDPKLGVASEENRKWTHLPKEK